MALLISKSSEAKLTIQGTSIELDSVYSRLEIAMFPNGKNIQVGLHYYESKEAYAEGKSQLKLAEMPKLLSFELDPESNQSLQSAHDSAKAKIEESSYSVAISDLV